MNNFFRTDDISLSAYLLSRGALFVDATIDRPKHFVFLFENLSVCEELKREYLNNGQCSARELLARREELVGMMREKNGYGDKKYEQFSR